MGTPLELYESQVAGVTDGCSDPWFADRLAASRAGDEAARRAFSGSCLRRVLGIARRVWRPGCPVGLLDLVQEGNAALWALTGNFAGATAEEFTRELDREVESRLRSVSGG